MVGFCGSRRRAAATKAGGSYPRKVVGSGMRGVCVTRGHRRAGWWCVHTIMKRWGFLKSVSTGCSSNKSTFFTRVTKQYIERRFGEEMDEFRANRPAGHRRLISFDAA